MGLMDLFTKKKPEVSETPTAVDYVDWLFQYMLSRSQSELVVDTRRALPGADARVGEMEPPPCIPDAAIVINRLKIMSGVNPLRQAKPIEGTFERPRKHLTVVTTCRFQDTDEYSICKIRMLVKNLTT